MSQMFPSFKSLLSRPRILTAIEVGDIVVDPFNPENVGTNQYDVSLGTHFFRAVTDKNDPDLLNLGDKPIYNPFSQKIVEKTWVQQKAKHHETVMRALGWDRPLENIGPEERLIMINPGETILAHTNEFIGGTSPNITTMMKARSSTGRNFIEVCKCAGMGDIGYCNRWTMEITNNNVDCVLPLVVGRRIAQIVFFQTDALDADDFDYAKSGKYQTSSDLNTLKASWKPYDMLPKQWRDREVKALNK